jgi:hypothetical protein
MQKDFYEIYKDLYELRENERDVVENVYFP